jgi:ABC-type molybdenum transport system ATPase subunit/photorepair protein PhrA
MNMHVDNETWALEVEDLTVAYAEQPVLWDVDLKVPTGVKMAIVGPNGAGKSTLVKAAMGLVKPVAGEVRVFGRSHERAQGEIAYVPQRTTLSWDFPTDVLDVVTMGTYGRLGWFRRAGAVQRSEAEVRAANNRGFFSAERLLRTHRSTFSMSRSRVSMRRPSKRSSRFSTVSPTKAKPSSSSTTICRQCPSTLTGCCYSMFAPSNSGR